MDVLRLGYRSLSWKNSFISTKQICFKNAQNPIHHYKRYICVVAQRLRISQSKCQGRNYIIDIFFNHYEIHMESMLESLTPTSFLYFSFDNDVLVLRYSQVISTSQTVIDFLLN